MEWDPVHQTQYSNLGIAAEGDTLYSPLIVFMLLQEKKCWEVIVNPNIALHLVRVDWGNPEDTAWKHQDVHWLDIIHAKKNPSMCINHLYIFVTF